MKILQAEELELELENFGEELENFGEELENFEEEIIQTIVDEPVETMNFALISVIIIGLVVAVVLFMKLKK